MGIYNSFEFNLVVLWTNQHFFPHLVLPRFVAFARLSRFTRLYGFGGAYLFGLLMSLRQILHLLSKIVITLLETILVELLMLLLLREKVLGYGVVVARDLTVFDRRVFHKVLLLLNERVQHIFLVVFKMQRLGSHHLLVIELHLEVHLFNCQGVVIGRPDVA